MSVRYTSPIWRLELPPAPKMILLKFGDNANVDGYAWPSIGRVAAETGYSERTVRNQVRTFRADGVLVSKRGGKGGRAPRDDDGHQAGKTTRYFIDINRAQDLYRKNGAGFGTGLSGASEAANPESPAGLDNPATDDRNPATDGRNPATDDRASIEEPSSEPSSEPARAREAGGGAPEGPPPACAVWRDNRAALEALACWPLLERAIPDHDDGEILTVAVEAPAVGFAILAWAARDAERVVGRHLACRVRRWVQPALIERGIQGSGVAETSVHRREGEPVTLEDPAWRLWRGKEQALKGADCDAVVSLCLPDDLERSGALVLVTGSMAIRNMLYEDLGERAAWVLGAPIRVRTLWCIDLLMDARAAKTASASVK